MLYASIQLFTPVDITILTMVRLYCATLLLRARKERSSKLGKASTSLLAIKKSTFKGLLTRVIILITASFSLRPADRTGEDLDIVHAKLKVHNSYLLKEVVEG